MAKTYSAEPDGDGYFQVSSEDGEEIIVSGLSETDANNIAARINKGESIEKVLEDI